MSLRLAAPGDAATLDAFLAGHAETSMFLRSNLARFGIGNTEGLHGTEFHLREEGGRIVGVFGLSNSGYLLAQAPEATPEDWAAFRVAILGRSTHGMTGEPDQVRAAMDALGFANAPKRVDQDEPLFALDLDHMVPHPGATRPPTPKDRDALIQMLAEHNVETGFADISDPPPARAIEQAEGFIASGELEVLEQDGTIVAMAGVNARLPDIVQIGSVHTKPAHRCRGHARTVLAGLLRRCRAQGVTRSILFAHTGFAARAYEALGYRHVGAYRICMLHSAQTIKAAP